MKLPCSVVRDLLPVYAEKLVEQETRELVEQHLAECAACRRRLSDMKEEPAPPVETSAPLQKLKEQIRRQRWRAVLLAALSVFIMLFVYHFHAGSMKLLPWKEGLVRVEGIETAAPEERIGRTYRMLQTGTETTPEAYTGDALILRTDSSVAGTMTQTAVEDDGTVTVFLQALGRDARGMDSSGAAGELALCPVPDRVLYGYAEPQRLLWGEPLNGGAQVLPRLALAYYLLIALAAGGLCGLLWWILRKRKHSRIPRQLFFAPVAYILSHLLLKGTGTASFLMERDLAGILVLALAVYAWITVAWQVLRAKRAEA